MASADWKLILADAILLIHFTIVAFIVLGLPVIWLGYFRHWRIARNFWFRLAHLGLMAAVSVQAVAGIVCPLTVWENQLRLSAGLEARYETTFIEHWIGRLMFHDLPPAVFAAGYCGFLILLIIAWMIVPPEFRRIEKTH